MIDITNKFKSDRNLSGIFLIEVRRCGKIIAKKIIVNRLTDLYINSISNTLVGVVPDFEINFVAVGTSNKIIEDTDTMLDAEIFRITPTSAPTLVSLGVVRTQFILSKLVAIGQLEEIGIFCGSTATGSADTGNMLSRILWSFTKTANDEVFITRFDRTQRG
jgi:hypothetical protein